MDAYTVGVYGGNDFLGVIGPHLYFQGKPIPQPIRDKAQVGAAKKINASALSQGFFALSHFATKPGDEALALHAASEVTLALAERCELFVHGRSALAANVWAPPCVAACPPRP